MTSTATTKPKIFWILISVAIIVSIIILLVIFRPWSDRAPAELKTGTTDGGRVTFIDSSTGEEVNIQVVDDASGVPVDGIEVTYFDGEGYEVFITYDASEQYLPAIGIYEHNSNHVIETKRSGHGTYQIFAFEDEGTQRAARKWKHDNHMDWSYYEYVKTIDYEEKMEMQKLLGKINDFLFNRILYFFAASSPLSPSQIVEYFCPEPENPPQRWDIYDRTGTYYADSFAVVPSNIPEVEITSLTVDDNEVSASWTGSDKDHYEVRVDLPINKDLTKYVDGNDTHDLKYSYRITSGGQVYGGYDWTQYSSGTSVEVEITESGSYRFEVKVKDEVNNIGATSRDFEIKSADIEEPDSVVKPMVGYVPEGWFCDLESDNLRYINYIDAYSDSSVEILYDDVPLELKGKENDGDALITAATEMIGGEPFERKTMVVAGSLAGCVKSHAAYGLIRIRMVFVLGSTYVRIYAIYDGTHEKETEVMSLIDSIYL